MKPLSAVEQIKGVGIHVNSSADWPGPPVCSEEKENPRVLLGPGSIGWAGTWLCHRSRLSEPRPGCALKAAFEETFSEIRSWPHTLCSLKAVLYSGAETSDFSWSLPPPHSWPIVILFLNFSKSFSPRCPLCKLSGTLWPGCSA